MFNLDQFRSQVVQTALDKLNLYSKSAEQLLILTCAQETQGGTFIKQVDGPALGIFQMEPKTHEDLWATFLPRRSDLVYRLLQAVHLSTKPPADCLQYNLLYAAMMCRLKYFFIKDPLPEADDIKGMSIYWHKFYNCNPNVNPEDAVIAYNKFMGIKKTK